MNSKYQNGKIYCIWSYETDDIYIGSTCDELDVRMYSHRTMYNRLLKGKKVSNRKSFEILKYGDAQIGIIEEYPCNTKQELLKREGDLQKQIKCVNKQIAGRTDKEYYEDNKEKFKEYYEKNKETIEKYRKENHDCECGSCYTYSNKTNHFKTKRHIKWLKENKKLITDNIEDGEEKKE